MTTREFTDDTAEQIHADLAAGTITQHEALGRWHAMSWRERAGEGPWDGEPDREVWIDPATGLDCMVRRNRYGTLCGYVGVKPSYQLPYSDWDSENPVQQAVGDLRVHGGLTYSAMCDGDPEDGICHVKAPGDPDEVYWFGFDCGHAWDVTPGMRCSIPGFEWPHPAVAETETYRTFDYAKSEVLSLAGQLAAIDAPPADHGALV